MAKVVANMSMSLDGFIADPNDGIEHLFGWYGGGDVAVPTADPQMTFRTSEASAADLRALFTSVGALVCGRRLFDLTGGWGGNHPTGAPIFVVTHAVPEGWPQEGVPVEFVTRRRHPLLRQLRRRSDRAGRPAGHRRGRCDPPALPRETRFRMSRARYPPTPA